MKKTVIVLALLFSVAAFARNITEKDLFRFNWIGDPQLSPDGSQIAFVRVKVDEKGDKYLTSIWSVAASPGSQPREITNGPRDSSPRWSPDGKTLAFVRALEKDGKPQPGQIYLLSMSGGEPRALTSMPKSVESLAWSPNGKQIAFTATTKASDFEKKKEKEKDDERESDVRIINQAHYRQNGAGYDDPTRFTHIWVIDAPDAAKPQQSPDAEAKPKQLTSGEFDEGGIAWSPDGSRIYFVSVRVNEPYYDEREADLYYVAPTGGDFVKIDTGSKGSISRISPSPDGKWIAYTGSLSKPVLSYTQPDLFVVPSNGGDAKNLTASFDNDVMPGLTGDQRAPRSAGTSRPVWSDDSKSIVMTIGEQGKTNLVRVDAATGNMIRWTSGNHDVQVFGIANGRTIALVSTPTIIGDLYAVDDHGAMQRITNMNEKLFGEVTLTAPEELWYASFDGQKIEAWIQKPPDFDPTKKYPLILNIHGGPHAAYGYTFDHEFQWMAAKGYVVLYPNPRGSTTYGQDFGNIIQYKYPGDDYKDLMAGVDAVIARGYIDPKKLGITGGSGGGVLTNWSITQTDRFAAAVSQRSIADWAGFWYDADFTLFQPTWFRKAPFQDPQDFAQRSAITFIDRVHTPLMLIEGESDYRTPPATGGEMMFRALKYLHRPTVMIRFPSESHELSRSGNPWHRVERLEHIVAWFDKWLTGAKIDTYDKGLRQ
jgi:dipeptidyl aminopeptidase/acylaminoacyl peptidase